MDKYYFVNTNHSNSKITDVIILLEFFVIVFQLLVDISISTNDDRLFAELFFYWYEATFMQGLFKKKTKC